ncbi:hypothetical protein BS47DRAFT_1370678 [Hydnum rufescens UP504]|uniref:Cullin family profile domain-containing protein n=1 Tax=Hydnum rufescens UP504 TaxID=1448309 RepID=A0A9P6DZN1_9AGAM|nr:hypothetical protein BS47DRAFT_1370678 [Hydnum rufescens UP504]
MWRPQSMDFTGVTPSYDLRDVPGNDLGACQLDLELDRARLLGSDTNQETWNLLSNAIREIQNHNASRLSFEENYRYAYNMVLYKQGTILYEGVKKLVSDNLDKLALESIVPAFPVAGENDSVQDGQDGERLLKAFRAIWEDHTSSMSKLRDLLKYMDRVYIQTQRVPPIWDAGLQLIFGVQFCDLIRLERDGYPVNKSAIKGCIDGGSITVFRTELEPGILEESDSYYKNEGDFLLETCDAPEYLRRAEDRLDSERARATHYLPTIEDDLVSILKNRLLTPHLSAIVKGALARLYKLFVMVPAGLSTLKKALKDSIAARGKHVNDAGGNDADPDVDVVQVEEELYQGKGKGKGKAIPPQAVPPGRKTLDIALKWVQDVLDLKDLFDRILKTSFLDDKGIQASLNEAFEWFINLNPKAPEYISLFIDENLKKGLKGKTDDEVDNVLDKTTTVFRFVTEKDVFERYYKSHLAKRLLTGRSVSDDAERGMLAKLKVECGFQFTQKLEGMFHDMKISNDTMNAYQEHLAKSMTPPPPIQLSVQVLTSTFWPMSHAPTPCRLSNDMLKSCAAFERFYLSRHNGRRLSWEPTLGNADVRVRFKSKSHDLNVSTYALVILLLFETLGPEDILTYEELKEATAIPDADLQRNLQSLACAKFKILKKHPPGRDVDTDDSFSFNEDFTSSLTRIKINTIAAKVESNDQRKETLGKVDEERKFLTEVSHYDLPSPAQS